MNISRKLEEFSKIAEKEAQARRIKMLQEIDMKMKEAVGQVEEEVKRRAEERLAQERAVFESQNGQKLMAASAASRKLLTEKRQELSEQVFRNVEAMLTAFMATGEYSRYILDSIEEAAGMGQNITVIHNKADETIIESLKTDAAQFGAAVTYKTVETAMTGGVLIYIDGTNKLLDKSFDAALTEQRREFNRLRI